MVIYLDEYRKAKAIRVAEQERHGEDRECIDTSAIATVAAIFCFQQPCELSPELPEDPASADLDGVLDRIHALASQC